ncbi:MAG: T9SS type A sorting domain-containing protein [Sphingobacteriales bacterium]|nr:T9SS type A sorting domain-containing protein [Sphingobacteriales bacterium]
MKLIFGIILLTICSNAWLLVQGQGDGVINRITTSSTGRAILDPNGDGYTSKTTSGFLGSDVTNSEIAYKIVPSFSTEPFGDLSRGPSHLFSDIVPTAGGSGFYAYYDGTNLLFRFRLGSIISGSKGYSVLIDTDGKFGATGTNADPNYQAATTGANGNPGFEIEVVLETNSRIAIYNVDGTSTPTLVKSYTNWQDMSQVSIAATSDNGTPDFFMDFYVPFSDLTASPFNLTTSSSIRFLATTVMSPQAAIGGPKSDIYGLADNLYSNTNDQYTAYINAQCGTTVTNLGSSGSGLCGMCTAPPTVNSPISTGTVNISGTWTVSSLTGAVTTATITIYKNGVSVGTIASVSSGTTWTLSGVSVAVNDVITAKAQGSGESMCLVSNSVTANSCNSTNKPATPTLNCYTTSKGITGTNLSTGWTIHVDNITRSTTNDNVTNSGGLFAAPTGSSPNLTWNYSSGCTGGSPLLSGSYKVYYTNNTSGCISEAVFVCVAGNGGSALAGTVATPVITSPSSGNITTATTSITGTTDAGASVKLYIDGINTASAAATGGTFTFSGLSLTPGQRVYITAEYNNGTVSTSKCEAQTATITVTCFTNPPIITVDNNNQLTAGQAITGTSGDGTGTTIRVYTLATTLVATTTVQSGGTWSTGNASTTPATYVAVAGTSYYATAQNGSCGVSSSTSNSASVTATSSARCGTISGTPISSSAITVSGTLSSAIASTTVNLYLDDVLIGTTTTNTISWGPITVNSTSSNTLYANGVLKIAVQESGKQEVVCTSSATTISCSPTPVAPVYIPTLSSISLNQSITYTISNAVSGYFYGVADATTGKSYASGKWATSSGSLNITTNTFTSSGSYNIVIKATAISGVTVCTATGATASLNVSSTLPLTLLSFTGGWEDNKALLSWVTETETNVNCFEIERSVTGSGFVKIGSIKATSIPALRNTYSFTDDNPLLPITYYRLKMIDEDGKSKYSPVVVLKETNKQTISAYPNPFTDKIKIGYESRMNTQLDIVITDISGKLVYTKNFVVNKGSNLLVINNAGTFLTGVYFLKLTDRSDNSFTYFKLTK